MQDINAFCSIDNVIGLLDMLSQQDEKSFMRAAQGTYELVCEILKAQMSFRDADHVNSFLNVFSKINGIVVSRASLLSDEPHDDVPMCLFKIYGSVTSVLAAHAPIDLYKGFVAEQLNKVTEACVQHPENFTVSQFNSIMSSWLPIVDKF